MPAQISFTTEFSPEGLVELHKRLGALVASAPTLTSDPGAGPSKEPPSAVASSAPDVTSDFGPFAKELRSSIGSSLQALVRQMNAYGEAEFTMPDVARDLGLPEAKVQAQFRNLSKPVNRLREKYKTGYPWPAEKRQGRWYFRAEPSWRDAVERTWAE